MFLYRLALALGRHDITQFAEELTVEDFFGWLEYWKAEPFGMPWHRTASLAYTAAASAGAKPGADFMDKFMPSYDPHPIQSEAEMAAQFAKLKRHCNGS